MRYLVTMLAFAVASVAGGRIAPCCKPACPTHCCPCELGDIERDCIAPYVELRSAGRIGSGVHLGHGLLLTAKHVVVEDACMAVTQSQLGTVNVTRQATVVYRGPACDLALVQVEEWEGLVAAKMLTGSVKTGEACYYVGTPYGFHRSLERSVINSPRVKVDVHTYFTTNGNGGRGNSGGPLYVQRGGRWVLAGIAARYAFVYDGTPAPVSPICFIGMQEIEACLRGYNEGP